jgi:hypothetical protein
MPDDPIERTVRQYIAHGASEGAMSAAQRISEAVGVGLDEVLAAVQKLGSWEAGAPLAGEGSLTVGATVTTPAGVVIVSADTAAATDGLGVVRRVDVDHLSAQASPSGLARLRESVDPIGCHPDSCYLPGCSRPTRRGQSRMMRRWLQL